MKKSLFEIFVTIVTLRHISDDIELLIYERMEINKLVLVLSSDLYPGDW